ncbi:hypothetical protein Tco_0904998 [Tanacetum coccineum]
MKVVKTVKVVIAETVKVVIHVEKQAPSNSTNDAQQEKNRGDCIESDATGSKTLECSQNVVKAFHILVLGQEQVNAQHLLETSKQKTGKGFSFIDEMNRIIEVGGALGYDVKGCKHSLRKMINGIDSMMSLEEIKVAIWDCGSQKASGPDGYSFMFVINHEQYAFISSLQILDGPLILSEVIDWYKKRKKNMTWCKVDFEKAFDSDWKANLLSSVSHLIFIKSVLGSLGIYYFSIFKAPEAVTKVLESLRTSFFGVRPLTKRSLLGLNSLIF